MANTPDNHFDDLFPDDVLAWKAERDAAIGRGIELWGYLDYALDEYQAAEALAETRLNYGLWALSTIKGMLHHGDVVTIVPGRWLTPAEALRAKHRSDRDRTPSTESPQSGQKEGDGV